MILHTVVISFQRLALLQQTIESYHATVTVPHHLVVVDNGSDDDVLTWLIDNMPNADVIYLGENRYPGYAANKGFAVAKPEATHLHRSDSDMLYLPGWCDHVQEAFAQDEQIKLVGLRTIEEELGVEINTGGTVVISKDIWDMGLRYDERPWDGPMTEDWAICQEIVARGYLWGRVTEPSVVHLASGDTNDPYYQHSYGVRGIIRRRKRR